MIHVLIALILMSSIFPIVFADESGNTSNTVKIDIETQRQVEIMNNEMGAQIRLLQLEKAIIKNINIGEEIISYLNDTDVDSTTLQVILVEFGLLKEEIQSVVPTASNAIDMFVDLKHDAVNLTTEFRIVLQGLLHDSMLNQLQQQTRNMTCNQTQYLSGLIENKIRQYNRNQFQHIYQILGENGSTSILSYQNGSMTKNQVKQHITLRFNQTEKNVQFNLMSSLKQQKIRQRIQSQVQIQNASEGFQQRQENRWRNRLQKIEDSLDNPLYQQLMNRIQHKLNNIDDSGGPGPGGDGNENNNGGNSVNGEDENDKPGYGDNGGSNMPGGES